MKVSDTTYYCTIQMCCSHTDIITPHPVALQQNISTVFSFRSACDVSLGTLCISLSRAVCREQCLLCSVINKCIYPASPSSGSSVSLTCWLIKKKNLFCLLAVRPVTDGSAGAKSLQAARWEFLWLRIPLSKLRTNLIIKHATCSCLNCDAAFLL